jgi:hypothetical protein
MKTITIDVTADFYSSQSIEVEVDDDFDELDNDAVMSLARDNVNWEAFDTPEINDILSACVESE